MNHADATIAMLGIVGVVVLFAALLSGVVERHRLPQTLLFLLFGVALGPFGFGLFDIQLESTTIRVISILGLVFVLFTDAVRIRFEDLRQNARLAGLLLGPGALLTAVIVTIAAHALLGLGWPQSAIVGAALASTDPVLLRGIIQYKGTPERTRHALRLESGMNDALLLPVILLAIALISPEIGARESPWWQIVAQVVVIGIGTGMIIGWLAVRALEWMRGFAGVRRDYEALYVIGVSLTAFAVAELVGGSGYIAAFAAGMTIAALDVEMCDCFFDYGEATTEMALLFAFVTLGLSALWLGIREASVAGLVFVAIALLARPLILLIALAPVKLDRRSRAMIVWFGPRGLSSLLLVLLAVFAGVPDAERLFAVTALVVIASVIIHGGSQMFLPTVEMPAPPASVTPPSRGSTTDRDKVADRERITFEELAALEREGQRYALLDVRQPADFAKTTTMAAGAQRILPDDVVRGVTRLGLPYDTWLILYCT